MDRTVSFLSLNLPLKLRAQALCLNSSCPLTQRVIGFSISSLFDDLAAGDCTSCRVTQDKSAYWHPQLYFKDDNTGEYEEVDPLGGMLA